MCKDEFLSFFAKMKGYPRDGVKVYAGVLLPNKKQHYPTILSPISPRHKKHCNSHLQTFFFLHKKIPALWLHLLRGLSFLFLSALKKFGLGSGISEGLGSGPRSGFEVPLRYVAHFELLHQSLRCTEKNQFRTVIIRTGPDPIFLKVRIRI